MKVQVRSDVLNQKSVAASVRSDYEQAKIQHKADEAMLESKVGSVVTENLSKVREQNFYTNIY